MIRKVFYLGVLAALWAGTNVSLAASAQLRKIELSATPEGAQITLDLSANTTQKIFRLSHPDRAVIDLGHTRLAGAVHAPGGDGVIEDIHTGAQPGGTLRVVIRLKSPVSVRSFWASTASSPGAHRLIISIGRRSAHAPDPASSVTRTVSSAPGPASSPSPGRAPVELSTESQAADPGAAATLTAVRPAHAPGDSDRDVVIAVDAGHGGVDPGATGRGGTREKDVTLAIARALAERINGEPGMKAVLTRDKDEFIELRDRIGRARVAQADMFVSVHADAILDRTVSGASVYALSEKGATNEAARWLAARENAADLMGGVRLKNKDNTLASVLLDLSQSANISASITAAQDVLTSLDGVGQVRKSQVQQAAFVVLKSPDIPSILVETAYISNPAEELRLKTASQQGKLAEAIFVGVHGYFEQNPPSGTRFAQAHHSTVASVVASPAATR